MFSEEAILCLKRIFPHLDIQHIIFPVSDARSYFQGGGEVICENESLQVGEDYIENEYLRVEFDSKSGWIKSLYDKAEQKELISEHSAVPVVIDEAAHDTWSHALNTFDKEIGCFYDAKISVTKRGPVRATLRVESKYNASRLMQLYRRTGNAKSRKAFICC